MYVCTYTYIYIYIYIHDHIICLACDTRALDAFSKRIIFLPDRGSDSGAPRSSPAAASSCTGS